MTRAPKAARGEAEWAVYMLRKRATLLGRVQAQDEKEALERGYEEFNIPADRFRVSVKRMA